MVTINQVQSEFVIDTSDSYVMPIGDLKDFWPGYSREERQAFRTTRKEHITMDAQKVLADIIGSATEDGESGCLAKKTFWGALWMNLRRH